MYTQRLVMDMGDACTNTTLDDLEHRNGNTPTSPSMMSQPSIGLVQRGGRCSSWREKINTVQALSSAYRLQITAVLIYDNVSYNDTVIQSDPTTTTDYPVWDPATLPPERNVSQMSENDLDLKTTFLAVYFVPFSYGARLLQSLESIFSDQAIKQQYIQVTTFLGETSFVTEGVATTNTTSNPHDDSNRDDIWSLFSGTRSYIIYIVVAIAVLILGVFFIRFFIVNRIRRQSGSVTRQLEESPQVTLAIIPIGSETERPPGTTISEKKLEKMSPIQAYSNEKLSNPEDTLCIICLDDFTDLSSVRTLPCGHIFCVPCIDRWLTKKSGVCPVCKFDCAKATDHIKDEEEEEEESSEETKTSCPTPLQ
ncbi:hypothetical protein J3Q64DRAFT_1277201 [Phycomyces blakesleeanus]|uniref:RING-type domain-containing protein n=1 Tax=Phycomyces blakesleeanus TaxID=4837 RepID=A0ABR3ANG3_PHYBL